VLRFLSVQDGDLVVTGTNLRIVSGSGANNDNGQLTGLGNLIVGYGLPSGSATTQGAHNLVIGRGNQYTAHSGIVTGINNQLHSMAGVVLSGHGNVVAEADYGVVIGGSKNGVYSVKSTVIGGYENVIDGPEGHALVAGGHENAGGGIAGVIVGGSQNSNRGQWATVLGGRSNNIDRTHAGILTGQASVIVGGTNQEANDRNSVTIGQ
jgi:hypothetical protein